MHAKMKICFTKVKKCPELGTVLRLQNAITRSHPYTRKPPQEADLCLQILQVPEIPGAWPHHHTASSRCGLGSTHCSVHKALAALGGGTGKGNVPGAGGL